MRKLTSKNIKRIMRLKDEQHRRRREAHIFKNGRGGKQKMPSITIQWSGKQFTPKFEPSYVIENREISRPPRPKYTPKHVSIMQVRKYKSDKARGII